MIPARYRDVLLETAEGKLTFTCNFDGGLLVYPRAQWESKLEEIMNLPANRASVKRTLLGNAFDVDIDKAGRVLIPAQLRERASLDKDVVLVGMGRHFDLWDAAKYEQLVAIDLEAGLPDDLGDFSL
ncbi:Transcriptional regulator MraZ [Oligella sp. MSHR50489EDL]|uniref:division/cell wall cluster transcriptional repressor MraZ n=1 Tax=Oligella sp. MSHR50489EDL TaxID=3139409 RepID=UPI003D8179D4